MKGRKIESQVIKFAQAFSAFNTVICQYFGKVLQRGFEESIKIFENAYLNIDITITTATHNVFVHLAQFCKLNNSSLAYFSEQASQTVHSDFQAIGMSSGKVNH